MKVAICLVIFAIVLTSGSAGLAAPDAAVNGILHQEIGPQESSENGIACSDAWLWYNDNFCGGFTSAGCSTACNGHRTYTCEPTRCHCRGCLMAKRPPKEKARWNNNDVEVQFCGVWTSSRV
ncbi:hypothetical protein Fcan01_01347 [Folsomia candida]|uniref:Uncharacterized protein n=1 Tax=Folsomia candida TaxID=158441 RepID=A0A226F028_FOLCA|nr:hypothetical protein Fcan01_01347 [Folsomia candida]